MILTGIDDEAGVRLDALIKAAHELGWNCLELRAVEVPGFARANVHDIPDQAFDLAADRLSETGLGVHCFGSAIANWSRKISDPFDLTLAEVKRCIPRMQRLGTKLVRLMSFKPGDAVKARDKQIYDSFVRYARQLEAMIGVIKAEFPKTTEA